AAVDLGRLGEGEPAALGVARGLDDLLHAAARAGLQPFRAVATQPRRPPRPDEAARRERERARATPSAMSTRKAEGRAPAAPPRPATWQVQESCSRGTAGGSPTVPPASGGMQASMRASAGQA